MSFHFDHKDKALYGFAKLFKKSSDKEREHAQHLWSIKSKRGGAIVLQDIAKPQVDTWDKALEDVTYPRKRS
jgi:ferritin heavy chain